MRQAAGHPVVAAGAAAATTAGAVGVVMIMTSSDPGAAPVPPPVAATTASAPLLERVSDGASLLSAPIDLGAQEHQAVRANSVPVLAVAADEGFWVGTGDRTRVWVQMRTAGRESSAKVKIGDSVTFTGEIVAHDANFANQVGVSKAEGAALLTREGAHVSVQATDVSVTDR